MTDSRALPPERWLDSPAALPAVGLVVSMATLVQSYVLVKLFFLAAFLLASAWALLRGRSFAAHPRLVLFYVALGALGIVWALIGLQHGANHVTGVTDAVRLYVVWSAAFLLLYSLLRAERSLEVWHWSMVWAGIAISLLNLAGLADTYFGLGLISQAMRVELDLFVAARDGFFQITSQNIGTMFLIVPYLLATELRSDSVHRYRWLARLSLVLSLSLVALAGRRALWLAVALMPLAVLALGALTGSLGRLSRSGRRALFAYGTAAVVGVSLLPFAQVLPARVTSFGAFRYLSAAFTAQDERTIQKSYLVEAFAETPWFGSGFGSTARYLRDYERPWAGYELTYHQMLFNLGVVGTALLGGLVVAYLAMVVHLLRRNPEGSAVPFALLVAFCSLLLGATSNRYFGSFDLLFFVGLLPFLASFRSGFAPWAPREAR